MNIHIVPLIKRTALRSVGGVVILCSLSACSTLGISNDNMTYLSAQDAPALVDAQSIIGTSVPLYDIPATQPDNMRDTAPVTLIHKGSYKLPRPTPLNTSELASSSHTAASKTVTASVGKPSTPRLLTDKNGVVNLKIDGDEALIKAQLLRALKRANIHIPDDSLLSVGKLTINSNGQNYTMRIARSALSTIVAMQDSNGLIAAPAIAQPIFESIILFWQDPTA